MKTKNIYVIKDLITQEMRGEPFYCVSDMEAIREIQNMFINMEKQGHKPRYREFDLYHIGSIDAMYIEGCDARIVCNCANLENKINEYLDKLGV